MPIFDIVLIGLAVLMVIVLAVAIYFLTFYRKVAQGHALIVNTLRSEPEVTVTGRVVIPIIHKSEVMDISLKTIEIDRRGQEGLICRDNIRADIKVAFFVRVNKTAEDVLRVAQAIGCDRASDPATLEELFSAKFSEALKTVGKQLDFEDLYKERDHFRDKIIEVIGKDLNGYVLEDAAIDFLEQTPIEALDDNNILDAQGIRKITELTAEQKIKTNEARRDEEMRIKQKEVQAREAILELERQEADATAKQHREVSSVQMREQAEIDAVQADERLRAESARIATDEKLSVAEENKRRETEVAAKNRERVVAIEDERVERARALEAIDREREVELQRIAKEKALEQERKAIAEVTRERISVEKTVAEEEERIKELRVVAQADRAKQAEIIAGEAQAERALVAEIKAAEAAESAAASLAREKVIQAEAALEASEKEAQAKIRDAEGLQAQAAAKGLAEARVLEANALAEEKAGMAQVRVQEAQANAIELAGRAEAAAVRDRMAAEAEGLREKFEVMESLGAEGRAYEELRLKLDILQGVHMAQIEAGKEVAQSQAEMLAEAMKHADIDIVGGDGAFFERMVGAVSLSKSVDVLAEGDTIGSGLERLLNAEGGLGGSLRSALGDLSTEDLKNLSLSAFLARLAASGNQEVAEVIGRISGNSAHDSTK